MYINISILTAAIAIAHGAFAAPTVNVRTQFQNTEILKDLEDNNGLYKHENLLIRSTNTDTDANTNTLAKRTNPLLNSLHNAAGLVGAGILAYKGGRYLVDSWRERGDNVEQRIREEEKKKREEIKNRYIRGD